MGTRIAICGAGAIGGYFGAAMIRAGHDVTLIDPWPENVAAIRARGLTIATMDAEAGHTVAARALHVGDVQGLVREPPFDVIFIALKAYDTAWATQLMVPWLAPDGAIAALQNSLTEPVIAAIAGPERTHGCAIASLACEMTAPGHVRRLSPRGSVAVGPVAGKAGQSARLAEILASVEHTETTGNLLGVKWSKLVVNSMRNGLSALTGMSGRERDSTPETIALGIRLGAQAVQTGRAMGLTLADTGFCFDTLVSAGAGDGAAAERIAARMAEIAASRGADQRPSMGQDIRKGRRTETDWINGLVAQRGKALGLEVGAHARVNALIHRIERGELSPSPALARGIA